MNAVIEFKDWVPEPTCDLRRPYTAARCEMHPGHADPYHSGRDKNGRWHMWRAP